MYSLQDLSQLDRLLKDLGMTFYLEQSRDMTMFMPVDSAFDQLPFNIHSLSWQAKWRIIQYHIIPHDVVDLENVLKEGSQVEFESWEGTPLRVKKVVHGSEASHSTGEESDPVHTKPGSQTTFDFIINEEANIISVPPKIETFNGASYKINKVLIPPTITEEDLRPANQAERVNPEVYQRLRRRPAYDGEVGDDAETSQESTNNGIADPSELLEQQLASIDGTVKMERSATDPKLPGSFRPDPLALRSQETPEFLRGINRDHARWDDQVYHRLPQSESSEYLKKPGRIPLRCP